LFAAGTGNSSAVAREYRPPTGKKCRVFICHAGEQKRGFVAFLREAFNDRYPTLGVFMDEHSLEAGGEAMHDIEDALADAFVGVPPQQQL
jgi:hypothetical protein